MAITSDDQAVADFEAGTAWKRGKHYRSRTGLRSRRCNRCCVDTRCFTAARSKRQIAGPANRRIRFARGRAGVAGTEFRRSGICRARRLGRLDGRCSCIRGDRGIVEYLLGIGQERGAFRVRADRSRLVAKRAAGNAASFHVAWPQPCRGSSRVGARLGSGGVDGGTPPACG